MDQRELNYNSYRWAEKSIDEQVKKGDLSNAEARDILKGARENYSNGSAQKIIERRNDEKSN